MSTIFLSEHSNVKFFVINAITKKRAPTRIRTWVVRVRTRRDNHYTIGALKPHLRIERKTFRLQSERSNH